jgi:hypothetical protein
MYCNNNDRNNAILFIYYINYSMKYIFTNSFHGRTASVTCRGWQISQRQIRRLWMKLCGRLDCQVCSYGGLSGANRYWLKKLGGNIDNNGAEIC